MDDPDSPASASLEIVLTNSRRALVIGAGGGGDVLGAYVVGKFLELHSIEVILGGVAWQNPRVDPMPGPRKLSEVQNVTPVHPYIWRADVTTRTSTDAVFPESHIAAFTGKDTLLVDITGGACGVAAGLRSAMARLDADLLVGVDVGGDSLATGSEPGLASPLADSIMLAAFADLNQNGVNALWAVWGYGSDGELTHAELESAFAHIAHGGGLYGAWGLTRSVAAELEALVRTIPTEASAIPLESARGATGERSIRDGAAAVRLSPLQTLAFFVSPLVVFRELSRPARAVAQTDSVESANDRLHAMGLTSELDFERTLFATSARQSTYARSK